MDREKAKRRWYTPEQFDNDGPLRQMIYEATGPESRVLDAGAGAGDLFTYELKGKVAEMIGVDLDPRVESNSQLDRGLRADLTEIPLDDESVDVIFSRYVLEHVAEPARKRNKTVFMIESIGVGFYSRCGGTHQHFSVMQ